MFLSIINTFFLFDAYEDKNHKNINFLLLVNISYIMIIHISGTSGSGKTTLGNDLKKYINLK